VAEPAPTAKKRGLALTGTNTVMVAGVGVILMIVGVVVFGSTRRRRPRRYRV
jgi:LPXTG-motif cell wall-anchored protein